MRHKARAFGVLTVFIFLFMLAPEMASMAAAQNSTAATATASTSGLDTLGLPALNITITENGFEGIPTSIPAGRYLVTAKGSDPYMQVNFLQPTGMSIDDFLTALKSGGQASPASTDSENETPASGDGGDMAPPAFFYDFLIASGVSILPGQSNQAVIDLKPGNWIAWGGSPDATQKPIAFTVTGEMPTDLAAPESNATITLSDFAIDVTTGKLQVGHNIVKLENTSAQPHFLDLQKGPDGMTKEQVKGALDAEMTGTPVADGLNPETDFMPIVSTTTQSAGTSMWIAFDLEPGTYGAFCFFPDKDTGMPHAYMGMYNIFTIDK